VNTEKPGNIQCEQKDHEEINKKWIPVITGHSNKSRMLGI
jgi:hypothetical protein